MSGSSRSRHTPQAHHYHVHRLAPFLQAHVRLHGQRMLLVVGALRPHLAGLDARQLSLVAWALGKTRTALKAKVAEHAGPFPGVFASLAQAPGWCPVLRKCLSFVNLRPPSTG